MPQVFLFMIAGALGAVATFLLQKQGISVVVASCFVGLIGALIGYLCKSTHLPLVIFAGSFVGMTSISFGTLPLFFVAGLLSGFIYDTSLHIFVGYGGKLGTIAFISTILSNLLITHVGNLLISIFKN